MVETVELLQVHNQLKADEIESFSKFMYDVFYFKVGNERESIQARISILENYIELVRQMLISGFAKTTAQKVMIVNLTTKLVTQKELLELAIADEETVKNRMETARHFQKKTTHPIGLKSLPDAMESATI